MVFTTKMTLLRFDMKTAENIAHSPLVNMIFSPKCRLTHTAMPISNDLLRKLWRNCTHNGPPSSRSFSMTLEYPSYKRSSSVILRSKAVITCPRLIFVHNPSFHIRREAMTATLFASTFATVTQIFRRNPFSIENLIHRRCRDPRLPFNSHSREFLIHIQIKDYWSPLIFLTLCHLSGPSA